MKSKIGNQSPQAIEAGKYFQTRDKKRITELEQEVRELQSGKAAARELLNAAKFSILFYSDGYGWRRLAKAIEGYNRALARARRGRK